MHLSYKLGEGILICILFFWRILALFFEISLRNNCQHLLRFASFHVVLLVQVALYGVDLPLQIRQLLVQPLILCWILVGRLRAKGLLLLSLIIYWRRLVALLLAVFSMWLCLLFCAGGPVLFRCRWVFHPYTTTRPVGFIFSYSDFSEQIVSRSSLSTE